MLKIVFTFWLCAFASQSYAEDFEVTAEGWDNYGAILKFGVSEPKNKINMKYIESIASDMTRSLNYRGDEFFDQEIKNNVKPKVVATLKQLVSEQAMPSNKVQYTLRSFRERYREKSSYDFSSERLCFDLIGGYMSVKYPWGDGGSSKYDGNEINWAADGWRILINSKIGLSNATHEHLWLTGFKPAIINKDGSEYCIKVKDQAIAKMLKSKFNEDKVIAVIDANIIGKEVGDRFGAYVFAAITKQTHAKIISKETNETLYETDDVIARH